MTDNNADNSYLSDRKPRSHFATRREYLEHELQVMAPRRWRPNLPFRDYRFEWEDLVPAMATTIGKVVMVAAIVAAFAGPLGLSKEFVTENVRFEMIIAALLFVILISGFLNPTSNLAGACKMRWLAIPLGSLIAGVVAFALGAPFEFVTEPGIPNMNPAYWWGETTGWQLGLPDIYSFMAVAPFAVLAIAMWSPDFLGHQVFQKLNYPPKTERVLMDIDDTMVSASARQERGR